MSKFLADEKPRQAAFKASAADFSKAARKDGVSMYDRALRPDAVYTINLAGPAGKCKR
jgi:hypothetical protein